MPDQDITDFDGILRDTRLKLGTTTASDESAAEGQGEAADGRVRAVAKRGRLDSIELNPRLMRLPGAELAEHVTAASNAALDDLRAKAPTAEDAAIDPAALARGVRAAQDEGLRTMDMITQGLAAAMAQVRQRAQVSGDPSAEGGEFLLNQVQQTLNSVRGPVDAEDVRGTGEAADGQVHATALAGARIDSIDIAAKAMRRASQELAEHIVAAVNAALDDVQARSSGFAVADPAELKEQLRATQDMSLSHMRAYTQSLQNLMSSIQRR